MPNIGPMELIIILIIALVVFGPKRLPELGRSLGSGMREFKESIAGKGEKRRAPEGNPAAPELPQAAEAGEAPSDGARLAGPST